AKIVPAAGVDFKTIEVQGFTRKHPLNNFTTISMFIKAVKSAKKIISTFKPDVVVGTGGYVSGAIVYAAAKAGIPTMIHESNSVVGVANKFLGHYVDKICYTFDDAAKQFTEKKKLVKTGNPRSQQVLNLSSASLDMQSKWNLNPKVPTVLVFGGSRGALAINRIMLKSLTKLKKKPYQIIWVTGTYYYKEIAQKLTGVDYGENIKVLPYVKDMPA
ncbi:UDP-N-acetylglucosamine--N-acetylmuramyl-(pentapeptide) pyrophosphoryl-undecaprenol N-acetylglucosamine transferase, partial [Lactobacillus sp. XV13L]|nr:UDP-N-acetylglucosamine--N-acetylmuramyl-(pentapeptide) pyrophosphoryl-undecaprenol N-acetylglucosamine transferase [Lactobacillus sp. XV13L]